MANNLEAKHEHRESGIENRVSSTQNKPNLPDTQMNISFVVTKDYENEIALWLAKNKPKTNPILSASGGADSNATLQKWVITRISYLC
jgi:hypothetical protein